MNRDRCVELFISLADAFRKDVEKNMGYDVKIELENEIEREYNGVAERCKVSIYVDKNETDDEATITISDGYMHVSGDLNLKLLLTMVENVKKVLDEHSHIDGK